MGLKSGIIVPFQCKNIKKLLMIGGASEGRYLTLSDFKTAVWAAFGIYEFEFRNKKIDFHIPDQLLLLYLEQKKDVTNFIIEIVEASEPIVQPKASDPKPITPISREIVQRPVENALKPITQINTEIITASPVPSSSTVDAAPSMNIRKRRRIYTTRSHQANYASLTSDMEPDARFESIFETFDGKIVLNNFRRYHRLQEDDRRVLSRLIISKELENSESLKITRERFVKLSYLICSKFPSEIPEIYFVPYSPITKKVARGKLWECYNNCKRRSKNSIRRHNFVAGETEPLSDREDIQFLSQNDAPWDEVIVKWDESFEHRRKEISVRNDCSALAYFNKYLPLHLVNGYELFEHDFNKLYPDKSTRLLDNWNSICEKIVAVAVARYKNSIAQILEEYDTDMEMCALMLMPYILQINKRHHSEFGRSNPENIITHIVDVDPDTKFVEQLVQENENDELEPRVIVTGPLDGNKSSYVIINKTIYFLESPIKAVDLCFKIYHALNLMYPIKQDQSWLLLQRVGYDIITEKDAPNTTLSSFLADVFN